MGCANVRPPSLSDGADEAQFGSMGMNQRSNNRRDVIEVVIHETIIIRVGSCSLLSQTELINRRQQRKLEGQLSKLPRVQLPQLQLAQLERELEERQLQLEEPQRQLEKRQLQLGEPQFLQRQWEQELLRRQLERGQRPLVLVVSPRVK